MVRFLYPLADGSQDGDVLGEDVKFKNFFLCQRGRTITDVIFHVFCPQLKVKEVVLLFSSTTIKRLGDGVRQRLANIPPQIFL